MALTAIISVGRNGYIFFEFIGGKRVNSLITTVKVHEKNKSSVKNAITDALKKALEKGMGDNASLVRFDALDALSKKFNANPNPYIKTVLEQLNKIPTRSASKTSEPITERVQKERGPPLQLVPRRNKDEKITLQTIAKLMSTKDTKYSGAKLEEYAKNLPKLDRFIKENEKRITAMVFSAFNKLDKYDFELTIVLLGKKRNPSIDLKSPTDPVTLRVFLVDYIGKGNPLFAKELASLGGLKMYDQSLDGRKTINQSLDSKTLIAAIAYLRRVNNGELNPKVKPLPPLNLSTQITPAPQTLAQPTKELFVPRVAIIGDSITGEKIGQKAGYTMNLLSIIRAKINQSATVTPYGIKGQSSEQIADRFNRDILGKGFNTVIIQAGINDLYSNTKIRDPKVSEKIVVNVIRNLEKMIKAARNAKPPISVILLTIHPQKGYSLWTDVVQQRIDNINKWIMSKAGNGVTAVDLSSLGDKEGKMLKGLHNGGGLHLSQKGGEEVAKLIIEQGFKAERKIPSINAPQKAEDVVLKAAAEIVSLGNGAKPADLFKKLKELEGKTDPLKMSESMSIAAQRTFNDLKKDYPRFKAFLAIFQSRYGTISPDGENLHSNKVDSRASLAAESVIRFLNWSANAGSWKINNLNWDIKALNHLMDNRKPAVPEDLKHTPNIGKFPTFFPEKAGFKDVLLACAIYRWRLGNPSSIPGGWAAEPKKDVPKKEVPWLVK